jgi:hypothetical protein
MKRRCALFRLILQFRRVCIMRLSHSSDTEHRAWLVIASIAFANGSLFLVLISLYRI